MDAKVLIAAVEAAVVRDCGELAARSYSGRGMRGSECVGVTVPQGVSAFNLAAGIARALLEDAADDEEGFKAVDELAELRVSEDSMGLDTIVYFPQVEWPKEEEEEVEEDEEALA